MVSQIRVRIGEGERLNGAARDKRRNGVAGDQREVNPVLRTIQREAGRVAFRRITGADEADRLNDVREIRKNREPGVGDVGVEIFCRRRAINRTAGSLSARGIGRTGVDDIARQQEVESVGRRKR